MKQLYKQLKQVITVVLFLLAPITLAAQTKISGTVSDETKQTLPGVSVLVDGTKQGTITDMNGHFLFTAKKGQTVSFQYLGYQKTQIIIGDETIINGVLKGDSKALSEVVVTALGIKKDTKRIGYALQTVDGADLLKARDPNPISSLVGKVAGLSVGPSPEVLREPNVMIRGDKLTLYVIDGFPINTDTWNISPDDIETYTVLKGPAAAALYGSREVNGAILITTKKVIRNKRIDC